MGEQFHDGEVKIMWRREDIGCLSAEVRAQCDIYASKHSQRMIRPVSSLLAMALVRKSSNRSQFSSPDPLHINFNGVTGAQCCLEGSNCCI